MNFHFSGWKVGEALGPTFEEEHHEPGVPTEGGHVDGTPAVPGRHPHVRPEPDQQLPDIRTSLSTLLGHGLEGGEPLTVVLVDVDALNVLLQEPLQLCSLADGYQVQEVSLKVGITFYLRFINCLDGESGYWTDWSQHRFVNSSTILWFLCSHFVTTCHRVSLQASLASRFACQPVLSLDHDHGVCCVSVCAPHQLSDN